MNSAAVAAELKIKFMIMRAIIVLLGNKNGVK